MATYAIRGNGREYDATAYLNDNLKTTTAQYKAVVMDPTDAADLTVKMINTSAGALGAYHGIGIMQTVNTSGSDTGSLRMFGISKAYAAAAIAAGENLTVMEATSGANTGGYVTPYVTSEATSTTRPVIRRILGVALTDATATGQAITIMINPAMAAH